MRLFVDVTYKIPCEMSVGLCRCKGNVTEQFLDGTHARPSFEKMRGIAVPQGVRARVLETCGSRAPGEDGPGVAGPEPPTPHPHEQRGGRRQPSGSVCEESRTTVGHPSLDGPARRLAERNDALLVAFAAQPDPRRNQVDVVDVEADSFRDTRAARVEQFKQCAVALPHRGRRIGDVEQRRHLRRLEHPWQSCVAAWAGEPSSRIGCDDASSFEQCKEATYRGGLARHRRPRVLLAGQRGQIATEHQRLDLGRVRDPELGAEAGELTRIAQICLDGVGRQAALVGEVGLPLCDGMCPGGRETIGDVHVSQGRKPACPGQRPATVGA